MAKQVVSEVRIVLIVPMGRFVTNAFRVLDEDTVDAPVMG